jgi:predicted ABC-type ATPase
MQTCFIDHSQIIIRLTAQIVNKKEITNEDLIYDLVNYTIGSIKCFTTTSDKQSNIEVIKDAVKHGYVILLNKCLEKAL